MALTFTRRSLMPANPSRAQPFTTSTRHTMKARSSRKRGRRSQRRHPADLAALVLKAEHALLITTLKRLIDHHD